MKCLTSPKHHLEFERENIYTPTPPQMQSTETICTSQRRVRPPVPVRTDSSRSLASTTTSSGRSLDSSIYESSPAMSTPTNRAANLMTNGHFVPLQSVQEDECLDVDINEDKFCPKVNPIFFANRSAGRERERERNCFYHVRLVINSR